MIYSLSSTVPILLAETAGLQGPTECGPGQPDLTDDYMTRSRYALSGLSLLLALAIITAGCTGASSPSPKPNSTGPQIERGGSSVDQPLTYGTENLTLESARALIQNLTEREYNTSSLESALETGNLESVQRFLDQFWREHPEAHSYPPELSIDRITGTVMNLTASGNNLSAVQGALERGDADAARTLLEQFLQEHPEAELGSHVAELWAAGFDISASQTALDAGDVGRTREFLRNLTPSDQSNRRSPTPTSR